MADRVVIVTGGTGGLGRAVVARLLEEGARVVVPWVAEEETSRLEDHLGGLEGVHLLRADVSAGEEMDRVVATARDAGDLDTVVMLVGGFAMAPLAETDRATWEKMIHLNATTVFQSARSAFRALVERGGGRLVSVAAEPALERGAPGMGAYAASKAAVVSLTQTLAREGADHRITANAVAPRIIDTPANRSAMPDADPDTWIRPAEIADLIVFLTGPSGGGITGNVITLSRG